MQFLLSLVQLGAVTYESLDHSVGMLPVQELDHLVRVLADPVLGPAQVGSWKYQPHTRFKFTCSKHCRATVSRHRTSHGELKQLHKL